MILLSGILVYGKLFAVSQKRKNHANGNIVSNNGFKADPERKKELILIVKCENFLTKSDVEAE